MAANFIKSLQTICKEGGIHETILIVDNLMVDMSNPCFSATILYHLLQACIDRKDIDAGRMVHAVITRRRYVLDSFLGSHLIRMYALCGSLREANRVFYELRNPTIFAWTALILAHSKHSCSRTVIGLFHQLQLRHVAPGEHIYVSVLKACTDIEFLHEGMLIHGDIIERGLDSNITVCNVIISMYCTCGCFFDASRMFNKMHIMNVVTWNAMIAGCTKHNHATEALQLYHKMVHECRVMPDNVTIVLILNACASILALKCGNEIYVYLIEDAAVMDVNIINALIDMFAKCGDIDDAEWILQHAEIQDPITWSVMIAGYVQHGYIKAALELFRKMLQEGIEPDNVTLASVLQASSNLDDTTQGKLLHALVISSGDEQDVFIGSGLINMYSKAGSLEDAHRVFRKFKDHNVVTWSALISGYAQYGHGKEVLKLFVQMQQQHIIPNITTFVCILTMCSTVMLLEEGRLVHGYMIDGSHELNTSAGSALVDLYVKCGSLEDASVVFEKLQKRSISTWTAIISGYAQHHDYPSSLTFLNRMQMEGLKPNTITYISLISACSHLGLVVDGCYYFNCAKGDLPISPMHFNCMVDLFGRTGLLEEAEVLQRTLPYEMDFAGWVSLLTHCRMHGDANLAQQCFHWAVQLDDNHASIYTLMSNICCGS